MAMMKELNLTAEEVGGWATEASIMEDLIEFGLIEENPYEQIELDLYSEMHIQVKYENMFYKDEEFSVHHSLFEELPTKIEQLDYLVKVSDTFEKLNEDNCYYKIPKNTQNYTRAEAA